MSLLRALSLPFQMASLLFVAMTAVLMNLIGGAPELRLMRLLPIYWLLSWLNKYAFSLLELAANGSRHAPVASVEMLGPLGDPRVYIHPTLAAGVFITLAFTHSTAADVAAIVMALMMPASLAALAASPHALDSINPLMWARMIRGMGVYYLMLLALAVICGVSLWWLYDAPGPKILRFAVAEMLVLVLYAAIGGTIHLRRQELDFDPRNSPEREADRLEVQHERERQQIADEFYGAIRVRDTVLAVKGLNAWLATANGTRLARDVDTLIATALKWPEQKGLLTLLRAVIAHALETRQPGLAIQAAEAGVQHMPDFVLATAAETETLALYARQGGRRRLAATLIDNFGRLTAVALPETLARLRADLPV